MGRITEVDGQRRPAGGRSAFSPNRAASRALAAGILYRLDGGAAMSGSAPYRDVEEGRWYSAAIAWAEETGVVNGVGGDRFDPEGLVTREQFAAMLYRYADYKGYDVALLGDLSAFVDGGAVSGWAVTAMSWASAVGILDGLPGRVLAPRSHATRAQVAAMVMRFCKNVVPQEG